jgi:diguanylate cyclase (GGDEF)-like protein/PAS domain S-box-containing protein
MNFVALIYLACSIFYLISGMAELGRKNKKGANWAFGFLCLNLSLWSMLLLFMTLSSTAEAAAFYRRLMIACWSAFFIILLYFVLFLSGQDFFFNRLWKNALLLLPGIFCFGYYFFTPIEAVFMVPTSFGWAFAIPPDRGLFWDHYFTAYYAIFSLLALGISLFWNRVTPYTRERRQSLIIFFSILSTLVLGSITDVLLPILGISQLPPLTVVLCIICIAGLNHAITKYRMMSITPESIMMEVFMMMSEGLIITDSRDQITTINAGAEKILGFCETELNNKTIETIFADPVAVNPHLKDNFSGQTVELITKSGDCIHALVSSHTQFDQFANRIGTVFTFQNINELKAAEAALAESNQNLEEKVLKRTRELETINEQLHFEISEKNKKEEKIRRMIYQDSLTRLNNRRFFYEYLSKHISYCMRYNRAFSVLFLDLDGFKLINDSLGHDIGDQVLISVAIKLKQGLRESDIISRAGGDEFMILLHNTHTRMDLAQACRKILGLLEKPIPILSYNLHIGASIGVAVYPRDGLSPEALIKNADIAMYEAKDLGKGRYVFYDENLKEDLDENMALTNDLYYALENQEFELFYQPQVDANTETITGFEALIRWNHPFRGRISPLKFIPLAERTGLIIPIGEWVLKTAADQQLRFEKIFGRPLKMGVNLSIIQLKTAGFIDQVKNVLKASPINPENLEFEITETIFLEDTTAIVDQLHRLKDLGVGIAIDDFGTEYSSLAYLRKLPLDRIKIPKPFVEGIGTNEKDEAIIVSIIVLALKLGCTTVAEGVETAIQQNFLQENGCQDIQGYYFYQPMQAKKIEHLSSNFKTPQNPSE